MSASENRRLSRRLALVAIGMFGFAFALVPFYNQICVALGIYVAFIVSSMMAAQP